ncbi:unnamed protein product [Rhodiola kirilowii]
MDSSQSPQTEKISAEPVSLFDLLSREGSSITILPRINVSDSAAAAGRTLAVPPPPPSPPAKSFLSISLPSSQRPTSVIINKKKPGRNQISDAVAGEPRQEKNHMFIGRSKSCGDGRSSPPSIEYEVRLRRVSTVDHHESTHYEASFRKSTEAATNSNSSATHKSTAGGFKCGSLCLYLPAFIKGKPLTKKEAVDIQSMISRTMSREKFECGSWSAAAIVGDNYNMIEDQYSEDDSADGLSMNLYYELPLEMMETGNKVHRHSHFEKPELKGILINSVLKTSEGRKSNHNSSRHVRFSTETPTLFPSSPPSCITPRLSLAREEFNAFLEAQNS